MVQTGSCRFVLHEWLLFDFRLGQSSIVDQYLLVDYVCCVPSPLVIRLLAWDVKLEPIRAATSGQGHVQLAVREDGRL